MKQCHPTWRYCEVYHVFDNSIQSSVHVAIPHELLYDVVCWCDCDKLPSLSTWQAQGGHPATEDAVSIAHHPKSKPQVLTCGCAPDRNLQMCLIDSQPSSTSGDGMQSGSREWLDCCITSTDLRPPSFSCRSAWVAEWFVLSPECPGRKDFIKIWSDIKTYQDFKRVKRGDQKLRVQFLSHSLWLTFNLRHPHRCVAFLCFLTDVSVDL